MRVRLRARGVACALIAGSFIAAAAETAATRAADVEFGRYLSAECVTCHGAAKAHDTIPNIFGMEEATFAEVVKAYRAKSLANPVMQNIAGRLSDDEIAALAAYFAKADKPQ